MANKQYTAEFKREVLEMVANISCTRKPLSLLHTPKVLPKPCEQIIVAAPVIAGNRPDVSMTGEFFGLIHNHNPCPATPRRTSAENHAATVAARLLTSPLIEKVF